MIIDYFFYTNEQKLIFNELGLMDIFCTKKMKISYSNHQIPLFYDQQQLFSLYFLIDSYNKYMMRFSCPAKDCIKLLDKPGELTNCQ